MDKICFKNLKTNYFKKIISKKFYGGMRQTQGWQDKSGKIVAQLSKF
jgi:hypothetical protein